MLGPLLQWFDALILLGALRAPVRVLGVLVVVILAYIGWIELLVQPLNNLPQGRVTSGLPYPFLNNMEFAMRQGFYISTAAMALVFILLGAGAAWVRGRLC